MRTTLIPVCKSIVTLLIVNYYFIYIFIFCTRHFCCFSPLDNYDEDSDNGESDENEMPKLTSINDFFDDEAELSESDWSSDDENHEGDKLDKLDEEAGDKDELDEKLVKDGLDKIYM